LDERLREDEMLLSLSDGLVETALDEKEDRPTALEASMSLALPRWLERGSSGGKA
jgi:hypothetical protein